MIVTTVEEKRGTERHVTGPGWTSTRLIVKADGMGYSVHDTTVLEGAVWLAYAIPTMWLFLTKVHARSQAPARPSKTAEPVPSGRK